MGSRSTEFMLTTHTPFSGLYRLLKQHLCICLGVEERQSWFMHPNWWLMIRFTLPLYANVLTTNACLAPALQCASATSQFSRGVTRRLLHETRRDTRLGSRERKRDEIFTLFLRNPQWWNIWMENSLLFNWKSQNAKQFRCILKSTCNECYFTSILMNSMQ